MKDTSKWFGKVCQWKWLLFPYVIQHFHDSKVLSTFDFDKTKTTISYNFNQKIVLLSFPLKIDNRAKNPITNDFVKDVKDIENWNFCPVKKNMPYQLFLKIMRKWTKKMKAAITSFLASDSFSTFLQDVRQFLLPQRSQVRMFVNVQKRI